MVTTTTWSPSATGVIEGKTVTQNSKPDKFAKWTEEERLRHLNFRTIRTEDTKRIHAALDHLYRTAGTAPEGDGCFVLGETGAGKTTAVRMFTDQKYGELRTADPSGVWSRPVVAGTDLSPVVQRTANGGVHRPIAVVLVNPRPKFLSFLVDTAVALQVDLPKSVKFAQACEEVSRALEAQKVKMIIFDEAQHIIDGHMDAYSAADVFKVFAKSRVQVVCIGLPHAEALGRVNSQLDRLIQDRCVLRPMQCSIGDFPEINSAGRVVGREVRSKTPYRKFLEGIDRRDGINSVLPFDEESNLAAPDMALRIHQAGQGYVGKIMKLIQKAAALAIFDGSSRITKRHFEEAYRKQTGCPDSENWFRLEPLEMKELFGTLRLKGKLEEDRRREKEIKKHQWRVVDALAGRK
ncbi:TniB family NTP-binding protein [Bradyrhizobium elkanii]|uniref:TniB family NTP-binding protein n=1 Tax=Bradyrhizobium elkanii TaxID=29448 RepID=UPI0035151645